jgi:hypothetical protein
MMGNWFAAWAKLNEFRSTALRRDGGLDYYGYLTQHRLGGNSPKLAEVWAHRICPGMQLGKQRDRELTLRHGDAFFAISLLHVVQKIIWIYAS